MISIIIPTIGQARRDGLNSLLSDIGKQTLKEKEVIVIEGEDRQGRAINKGASKAKGDILVIMDDDARLGHPDVLKNLINVLESDTTIGMAGASTIPRPDDSLFQKIAIKQVPRRYCPVVHEVTESDMAHHPCCAIPKKVFQEIGGENEVLIRGLDPELRYRIRKKGYRIVIAPDSWIYHSLPGSMKGIFKMYYKNGKAAAYAYLTNPDLVFEAPWGLRNRYFTPKTNFSYRVLRYGKNLLLNFITLKAVALISMLAYGAGYAAEFFAQRLSQTRPGTERLLYNIRYFLAVLREISGIILKDLLMRRDDLFLQYLRGRLTLYNIGDLRKRYASGTLIWMHGNSLGDMNGVARLSKILKDDIHDIRIIASTTETGVYGLAKTAAWSIDEMLFLPYDMPFLIRRVFGKLRPGIFVTVEAISWPNLFMTLNGLSIRTMLFNGHGRQIREMAAGYGIPEGLSRRFLNKVDLFGMRSEEGARELIGLGVDKERVGVTGRFRIDYPADFPAEDEKRDLLNRFCLNEKTEVIVAASTWRGEEEIFIKAFKEVTAKYPNLVMVVAPRHIKRADEVCELALKNGLTAKKKSSLGGEEPEGGEIMVLDTLGELYALYGIARLTVMGGTFIRLLSGGCGGAAEPLFRGSPLITGMNTWLWESLMEEMRLPRASNGRELADAMAHILDNPAEAAASRDFALKVMDKYKGSFTRCVKEIEKNISIRKDE